MYNKVNFSDLRNKLTTEDVIRILSSFGIQPYMDTNAALIYPTVCHNLNGGSNKLYYYKGSKMFKCYTHCDGVFDIFELLIKMMKLRGKEITLFDAVKLCGIDPNSYIQKQTSSIEADINYVYNLLYTNYDIIDLPHLDKQILDRFVFDEVPLSIWQKEGISFDTMRKFNIKFDPIENCIIIPNYDIDNNLISVRGRFLNEDAAAKYKPIIYGGKVLSHPSSLALYGLNITKDAIKRTGRVIIFEGEKSVMMMDTYYGDNNFSVATLGKNISFQQIRLLSSLGVGEVMLAYDRDYMDYNSMDAKRQEYKKIAESLKTYFTVSYIMDLDFNLLKYKDSPIDQGKEAFEQLIKNRIYV